MSDRFEQGHACVIGVGGDLPSTINDALGFAKILKDPERCAYPVDQVKVLTGEDATRANIINALETLVSTTNAESTVLVYFSGHGYQLSGAIKSYFLMPYGYDSKDLSETAISGSEFVGLLRDIPAQKLLVLLDCCHAGGLSDLDGFQIAKAPLPPEATNLFSKGGGRMIIGSSRSDEKSFAAKPYSVFTYALIKGLCGEAQGKNEPDGYIRAADLAMYASRIVSSRTSDKQHPVLDIEKADNFVLAYYAAGDLQPKGLPNELEQPLEVESKVIQKVNKIANTIVQKGLEHVNINGNATIIVNQNSSNRYDEQILNSNQVSKPAIASVDELVKQVRSRIHDDIQKSHGTMPLWGVDHWVPLSELFVDVNILEELSSSGRSELDDLWQDYSQNPSYRSLDRIGLGKQQKRISGLEVLKRNKNLMVVGKPGSGKTTYLQSVVTESSAGNIQSYRIPVLIKLREFVDDGRNACYSIELYLEGCWQLSNAEIKLLLNQGRVLILLDGLDEIAGEDRKTITKEIKRFARDYSQILVIVTCRTQNQESRFERFDYVEIADFNEPQVRLFADHWFKAVARDDSDAKTQEFLKSLFLEENKQIRELAITPILLSLTCAVFFKTRKFYSKRSKLYKEGVELLLENWDKSREIERDRIYHDISVKRKLELLSYLAIRKFEQLQYVLFEQDEIEECIAEFLGIEKEDSRVVLKAMEAQHGLLIERSHKVWSFSHLTFQEYFVAREIINEYKFPSQTAKKSKSLKYIANNNWREIFYLTMEIFDQADSFLVNFKNSTDLLLANEPYLQEFLVWLNEKTKSIQTSHNLHAVRALYFARTIRPTYSEEMNERIFKSKVTIFNGIRTLAKRLDGKISDTPESDISIDRQMYYFLQRNEVIRSTDSEIQGILELGVNQKLRDRLLYIRHLLKHGSNSHIIPRMLHEVAIQERNIGHKWEFSNQQMELLYQYYIANDILSYCLQSQCSLTNKVRQKVEEELLLPISELERNSTSQ